MSQSLVNESAGARTPLSGLVAALFTLIVVLFASGLLRNLPQPVLAAIVLAAVMSLVDIAALQHIWRFSRAEFFVAMAALFGVLGSGPVNGVLLGAAISIVLLLRQAARPRVTELARVPGTTFFADRSRHPENASTPACSWSAASRRCSTSTSSIVRERVFELLARARRPSGSWSFLSARCRTSISPVPSSSPICTGPYAPGVAFRVADAHGEVRDALRRIGFEREHGPLETGQTVEAVVSAWQASQR